MHRDLARHEFLRRASISRDITLRCDPYVNNNISIHAEICNNLPGEIAGIDVDNNDVYCSRCNVLTTHPEYALGNDTRLVGRNAKGQRTPEQRIAEVAQEPENCASFLSETNSMRTQRGNAKQIVKCVVG